MELLEFLWLRPRLWQPRLVYRVELSTTTHARVDARYHVVIPPTLLEKASVEVTDQAVRVLLPLTWRPKELLLNVSLSSSSGNPVHLLTRAEVASLQATLFVNQLADTDLMLIDVDADDVQALVEAIARFMPRRVRAAVDLTEDSPQKEISSRLRDAVRLSGFLSAATGLSIESQHVQRWLERLRHPEGILAAVRPTSRSAESSSTNFVLALSELEPSALGDLDYFVEAFRFLVLGLHVRDETAVLSLLARLGSEWTVMVDTEMRTSGPVTIAMADDRPLRARDRQRKYLRVPVPLGDANSLHVETQLLDPSSILNDVKIVSAEGEEELFLSDDVRETDDRHAVYFAVADRPEQALARIEVGLTSDVRGTNNAVFALAAAALVLSLFVENDADILALLVIPATLAVSVVQVRERTSIVRSLTARSRRVLFGVAIALWLGGLAPSAHTVTSGVWVVRPGPQRGLQGVLMATNSGRGRGRVGAVKKRSQVINPKTGLWTKRDTASGKFIAIKESPGPYKGVRKER